MKFIKDTRRRDVPTTFHEKGDTSGKTGKDSDWMRLRTLRKQNDSGEPHLTHESINSYIETKIKKLLPHQQLPAQVMASDAAASTMERLDQSPTGKTIAAKERNKIIIAAVDDAISTSSKHNKKSIMEATIAETDKEAKKSSQFRPELATMPQVTTDHELKADQSLIEGDYDSFAAHNGDHTKDAHEEKKKGKSISLPFPKTATDIIVRLGKAIYGALDEFFLYRDRETMEREKGKFGTWKKRLESLMQEQGDELISQQSSFKQMNHAKSEGNWAEVLESYEIFRETKQETEEEKQAKQSAIDISKCDWFEKKNDEYVKTKTLSADNVKNSNIEKFGYEGGRFKIKLKDGSDFYTAPSKTLKLANGKMLDRSLHQVDQGAYDVVSETWTFPKRAGTSVFHSKNANFKQKGENPMIDRSIRRHELRYNRDTGKHELLSLDGSVPIIEIPKGEKINTDDDVPPDSMDLRQFDLTVTRKPGKTFIMYQVDTEEHKIENADKLKVKLENKDGKIVDSTLDKVIFYRWQTDTDSEGRDTGIFRFFTNYKSPDEGDEGPYHLVAKDGIISYTDEKGATQTLSAYELQLQYCDYNIDTKTQIMQKLKYNKDPLYSPELDERQRAWLNEDETHLRTAFTSHIDYTKRLLASILEKDDGTIKKVHELTAEDKARFNDAMTQISQGDASALLAIAGVKKIESPDWSYDVVPISVLFSPNKLFQEGGFMHDEVADMAPLWTSYENLVNRERLWALEVYKMAEGRSYQELEAMEKAILKKYFDFDEYNRLSSKNAGKKATEIEEQLPYDMLGKRIDYLITRRKLETNPDKLAQLNNRIIMLQDLHAKHKPDGKQSITEVRESLESMINEYNSVSDKTNVARREELSQQISNKCEELLKMLTPSTAFHTRLIIHDMIGNELATRIARDQLKAEDININHIKVAIAGMKGKALSSTELFAKIEKRLQEAEAARKQLEKVARLEENPPSAESMYRLRKLHGKLKEARGALSKDNPGEVFPSPENRLSRLTKQDRSWLHNLTWDMRDIESIAEGAPRFIQRCFLEQSEERFNATDTNTEALDKLVELCEAQRNVSNPTLSNKIRDTLHLKIRFIKNSYLGNEAKRMQIVKAITDAYDNIAEYASATGSRAVVGAAASPLPALPGPTATANDIMTWLTGDQIHLNMIHNAAAYHKQHQEERYAVALVGHLNNLNNGMTADIEGLHAKIARYKAITQNEHIKRALEACEGRVKTFESTHKKAKLKGLVRSIEKWKEALQPLPMPDATRHADIHNRITAIYTGKDNTISNLSHKLDELANDTSTPPTIHQQDILANIKIEVDQVTEAENRLLQLEQHRREIISPLLIDVSRIANERFITTYNAIITGNAHDLRALLLQIGENRKPEPIRQNSPSTMTNRLTSLGRRAFSEIAPDRITRKISKHTIQLNKLEAALSKMLKDDYQIPGIQGVFNKQEALKRIETETNDILIDLFNATSELTGLTDNQRDALVPLLTDIRRKRFNGFQTLEEMIQNTLNVRDGMTGGPKNPKDRRLLESWMTRVRDINTATKTQSEQIWKQEKVEDLIQSPSVRFIHRYVLDAIHKINKGKTPSEVINIIRERLSLDISEQERAELLIWQRRIEGVYTAETTSPESFDRIRSQIDRPLRTSPTHATIDIFAKYEEQTRKILEDITAFEANTLEDVEGLKSRITQRLKDIDVIGQTVAERTLKSVTSSRGTTFEMQMVAQHISELMQKHSRLLGHAIHPTINAANMAVDRELDIITKDISQSLNPIITDESQKSFIAKDIKWKIMYGEDIDTHVKDHIERLCTIPRNLADDIINIYDVHLKSILTHELGQTYHTEDSLSDIIYDKLKKELIGGNQTYWGLAATAIAHEAWKTKKSRKALNDAELHRKIRDVFTRIRRPGEDKIESTVGDVITKTKLNRDEKIKRIRYDIEKTISIMIGLNPEVQELQDWQYYLGLHTPRERIEHNRIIADKQQLLYHFTEISWSNIDTATRETIETQLTKLIHYPFERANLGTTIDTIKNRLSTIPALDATEQAELRALQQRLEYVKTSISDQEEPFKTLAQLLQPFTDETNHLFPTKGMTETDTERLQIQTALTNLLQGKQVNLQTLRNLVKKRKDTEGAGIPGEEKDQLGSLDTKLRTLIEQNDTYKETASKLHEALLPIKLPGSYTSITDEQLQVQLKALENGQTHNFERILELIQQRSQTIEAALTSSTVSTVDRETFNKERAALNDYKDRIEIFQRQGYDKKLNDLRAKERPMLPLRTKYLRDIVTRITNRLDGYELQPLGQNEIEKWIEEVQTFSLSGDQDTPQNQETLRLEREEVIQRLQDLVTQRTQWNNALDHQNRQLDEVITYEAERKIDTRNGILQELPQTFTQLSLPLLTRPHQGIFHANTVILNPIAETIHDQLLALDTGLLPVNRDDLKKHIGDRIRDFSTIENNLVDDITNILSVTDTEPSQKDWIDIITRNTNSRAELDSTKLTVLDKISHREYELLQPDLTLLGLTTHHNILLSKIIKPGTNTQEIISDHIEQFKKLPAEFANNVIQTLHDERKIDIIVSDIIAAMNRSRLSGVLPNMDTLEKNVFERLPDSYKKPIKRAIATTVAETTWEMIRTKAQVDPEYVVSEIEKNIKAILTPIKAPNPDTISTVATKVEKTASLDKGEKSKRFTAIIKEAIAKEIRNIPEIQELHVWNAHLTIHTPEQAKDHNNIIEQRKKLLYNFTDITWDNIDTTTRDTIKGHLSDLLGAPTKVENLDHAITAVTSRLGVTPGVTDLEHIKLKALEERLQYVKNKINTQHAFRELTKIQKPFTEDTNHILTDTGDSSEPIEHIRIRTHLDNLLKGKKVDLGTFHREIQEGLKKPGAGDKLSDDKERQLTALATKAQELLDNKIMYNYYLNKVQEELLPIRLPADENPPINDDALIVQLNAFKNGQTHDVTHIIRLIEHRLADIESALTRPSTSTATDHTDLNNEKAALEDYKTRFESFQSSGNDRELEDLRKQERLMLPLDTQHLRPIVARINNRLAEADLQPLRESEIDEWKTNVRDFTLPVYDDTPEERERVKIEREEVLARLDILRDNLQSDPNNIIALRHPLLTKPTRTAIRNASDSVILAKKDTTDLKSLINTNYSEFTEDPDKYKTQIDEYLTDLRTTSKNIVTGFMHLINNEPSLDWDTLENNAAIIEETQTAFRHVKYLAATAAHKTLRDMEFDIRDETEKYLGRIINNRELGMEISKRIWVKALRGDDIRPEIPSLLAKFRTVPANIADTITNIDEIKDLINSFKTATPPENPIESINNILRIHHSGGYLPGVDEFHISLIERTITEQILQKRNTTTLNDIKTAITRTFSTVPLTDDATTTAIIDDLNVEMTNKRSHRQEILEKELTRTCNSMVTKIPEYQALQNWKIYLEPRRSRSSAYNNGLMQIIQPFADIQHSAISAALWRKIKTAIQTSQHHPFPTRELDTVTHEIEQRLDDAGCTGDEKNQLEKVFYLFNTTRHSLAIQSNSRKYMMEKLEVFTADISHITSDYGKGSLERTQVQTYLAGLLHGIPLNIEDFIKTIDKRIAKLKSHETGEEDQLNLLKEKLTELHKENDNFIAHASNIQSIFSLIKLPYDNAIRNDELSERLTALSNGQTSNLDRIEHLIKERNDEIEANWNTSLSSRDHDKTIQEVKALDDLGNRISLMRYLGMAFRLADFHIITQSDRPIQVQYLKSITDKMQPRLTQLPQLKLQEVEQWIQEVEKFSLPPNIDKTPQNLAKLELEREDLLERLNSFKIQLVHWRTVRPIHQLLAKIQAGTSHDYNELLGRVEKRLGMDKTQVGYPDDEEKNRLSKLKRHLEALIKNESEMPYLADARNTYPLLVKPLQITHINAVAKNWEVQPDDPNQILAVRKLAQFINSDVPANRVTTIQILNHRIESRLTDHPRPGITETDTLKKTQKVLDDLVTQEQELNLTMYRLHLLLTPVRKLEVNSIHDEIRIDLLDLRSGENTDISKLISKIDLRLANAGTTKAERDQLVLIQNKLQDLLPHNEEIVRLAEMRERLLEPLILLPHKESLPPEIQDYLDDITTGRSNVAELIKYYANERLTALERLPSEISTDIRKDPDQPITGHIAPVAEQMNELQELHQRASHLTNYLRQHPEHPEQHLHAIRDLVKDIEAVEILDDLQTGDNETYMKQEILPLFDDLKKNRPPTTIYHFQERINERLKQLPVPPAVSTPAETAEYNKLSNWSRALRDLKDGKDLFLSMEAIHRTVAPLNQATVRVDLIQSSEILGDFYALRNGKAGNYAGLRKNVEKRLRDEKDILVRGEHEQLTILLKAIDEVEQNDSHSSWNTSLSTRVDSINKMLAFFDNENENDIDATKGLPTYLSEIKGRRFLLVDSLLYHLEDVLHEGEGALRLIKNKAEYERKVIQPVEEETLRRISSALQTSQDLQGLSLDLNTIEDQELADNVAALLDNSKLALAEVYEQVDAENKKNPTPELGVMLKHLKTLVDMSEAQQALENKFSDQADKAMLSYLQKALPYLSKSTLAEQKEVTEKAMASLKRQHDYIDEESAEKRATMLSRKMPQNLIDAEKEAETDTNLLTDAEAERLREMEAWLNASDIAKKHMARYQELKLKEQKSGEKSPEIDKHIQFFKDLDNNNGKKIRANRNKFREIKNASDRENSEAVVKLIAQLHDFENELRILKRRENHLDDPEFQILAHENEWVLQLRNASAKHQATLAQNTGKVGAVAELKLRVNTVESAHRSLENVEQGILSLGQAPDREAALKMLLEDHQPGFNHEQPPEEALFNGSWEDLPGKTLEEKIGNIFWYSERCAIQYITDIMSDKDVPRYIKSEIGASVHATINDHKKTIMQQLFDRGKRQESYEYHEHLNSEALRKLALEQRFAIARMKEMKAMIQKLLTMQLMLQSVEQAGMGAGNIAGGFDDAIARMGAWFGGLLR